MNTSKRNYDYTNFGVTFTQPSKTLPDQTMSLRTILDRHTRNLPIEGNLAEPQYSDEYTPNIHHMDLADKEDFINAKRSELNELQTKIDADKKAKATIKKQRELEELTAKIEADIKAKEKNNA